MLQGQRTWIMRILLVDDSLTIRTLIKRTLVVDPDTEISEAANGVEALAQIARRRFDLVVLDMNMPVMDGVETLESIRAAPDYAALPVVMLTSGKSEALVRRLVELRITDFLSKPLSPNVLSVRLGRILERLRTGERPHEADGADLSQRRMLIVEQDPDRRHFLATALAGHYKLTEADSAAAALQFCMADSPATFDVVLVGPHVGLPPVEMFLRKLRSLPPGASGRIIGCVPKGGQKADVGLRALFDAVVENSSVPEIFLADLVRAITGQQTPLARLLLVRPSLAEDMVSATEQVFGLMLSCEVVAAVPGAPRRHAWPGPCVMASIDLETADRAALNLLFRATRESADAIAGGLIGVAAGDVEEADVLASAAELVNIVHGRLRNRLVDADIPVQLGLPKTWIGVVPDGAHHDPEAIGVVITAPALNVEFELVLSAAAGPTA
jgi:two-component system chemotaxis response regulator CheY